MGLFILIVLPVVLVLGISFPNPTYAANDLYDCTIKRVTIPRELRKGSSGRVEVTVVNEGSSDWASAPKKPYLKCTCVRGPSGGRPRVEELCMPRGRIDLKNARKSGETYEFRYNIEGPPDTGNYSLVWQMCDPNGRPFGRESRPKPIKIYGVTKACMINRPDIRYTPNPVIVGRNVDFKILVRNTGDVKWGRDYDYTPVLKSKVVKKPPGASATCLEQEFKSDGIKPSGSYGDQYLFTGRLVAPRTVGAYHIRWQMYDGSSAVRESQDAILIVR